MASQSTVYLVGVGLSPLPEGPSPTQDLIGPLVSAATKALLDAGVTYDDIDLTVHGSVGSETSNAFGPGALNVDGIGDGSDFVSALDRVADGGTHSVLLMTVQKSNAFAVILASNRFLWRRPYLKDEAVLIRRSDTLRSPLDDQTTQTLYEICQIVWALRGWSRPQDAFQEDGRKSYQTGSGVSCELSRADGMGVPEWKDVEHKQDGKHRLGYNPATETKDISQEDLEAVRERGQGHKEFDDQDRFRRKGGDRAALAKL